jgi:hypothetical protein
MAQSYFVTTKSLGLARFLTSLKVVDIYLWSAGYNSVYRGYYTAARRYISLLSSSGENNILRASARHRVMFCLLYSPKQKIVKFHAQKQIGKSHVIDIFTSEGMENMSLCIFQYLTLYYIIKCYVELTFFADLNFWNCWLNVTVKMA